MSTKSERLLSQLQIMLGDHDHDYSAVRVFSEIDALIVTLRDIASAVRTNSPDMALKVIRRVGPGHVHLMELFDLLGDDMEMVDSESLVPLIRKMKIVFDNRREVNEQNEQIE